MATQPAIKKSKSASVASLEWLLLIYLLPSQPSRKRAYVWRELKKVGAVYLRDGVVVLPRSPELEARIENIAERIKEYEGSVDLILSTEFSAERGAELVQRFQDERTAEYRELHHACVRFLRDVLEEVDAEDFGFPDVDKLESELARLRRWHLQIDTRDYFRAPGGGEVSQILEKCERAFENFSATAAEQGDRPTEPESEDAFARLNAPSVRSHTTTPPDYPI